MAGLRKLLGFKLTILTDSWISDGLIWIPKDSRNLFPAGGEAITVIDYDLNGESIPPENIFSAHMHNTWKGRDVPRIDGLRRFYKRHPEIHVGSIVSVTIAKKGVIYLKPIENSISNDVFVKQKILEIRKKLKEAFVMLDELEQQPAYV